MTYKLVCADCEQICEVSAEAVEAMAGEGFEFCCDECSNERLLVEEQAARAYADQVEANRMLGEGPAHRRQIGGVR